MKNALLLVALLLFFAGSSFANTTYNNYHGFDPFWHPLGNPDTATYGETFTVPNGPDTGLTSFSFYLAGPLDPGDIIMGAYIATWTGTQAGSLVYSSTGVDYPNVDETKLTFDVGHICLDPGDYVMFLSVSQFYGQSSGTSYIDAGDPTIPGGSFVFYNNGGDFNALFTNAWDGTGTTPDWAVELNFVPCDEVPEPGTLMLLGTGLLGGIGAIRRKLS